MTKYAQYIDNAKDFLKSSGYQFANIIGAVTNPVAIDNDEIVVIVDTSVVPGRRKIGYLIYDKKGTLLEYNFKP